MMIDVYTNPNCAQCEATKRWLDRHDLPYTEITLEDNPDQVAAFKEQGYLQAPIVVTDTKIWSGFRLTNLEALRHQRR